jgi:hypothetical protein
MGRWSRAARRSAVVHVIAVAHVLRSFGFRSVTQASHSLFVPKLLDALLIVPLLKLSTFLTFDGSHLVTFSRGFLVHCRCLRLEPSNLRFLMPPRDDLLLQNKRPFPLHK